MVELSSEETRSDVRRYKVEQINGGGEEFILSTSLKCGSRLFEEGKQSSEVGRGSKFRFLVLESLLDGG